MATKKPKNPKFTLNLKDQVLSAKESCICIRQIAVMVPSIFLEKLLFSYEIWHTYSLPCKEHMLVILLLLIYLLLV